MMGQRDDGQSRFVYNFRLEDHVPADHLVRKIDAVLDTSWVHGELAPYYSHTGRPSIDPEVMIRMLILGYVFAIRSERRLCEEVQVNLAYRWFCRLDLEDRVADHSVFSRARHERFRQSDALRKVFEQVVAACISGGLVGSRSFSVDASLIAADVNKNKRVPGDEPIDWPAQQEASRAVRDYLVALDEAQESIDKGSGGGGRSDYGRSKPASQISLTDPQAAWVARKRQRAMFAYDANYLIDNKVGVIMDAEGTCANRSDEIAVAETMVERVERRFGVKPHRLAGDTVYGAARLLRWLMDRGIEPHVPVWDKSRQPDGKFSRADFNFDKQRNVYICPNGAELTSTGNIDQGRIVHYRASTKDCSVCPLKQKCTTAINRKVTRDIDQEVRDHVQSLANTPAFQHSSRERKKVEMAFAHMKRILKLDRLRLRGLTGARDEVLLTATAQNLRKLAKYVGHSPPKRAICSA